MDGAQGGSQVGGTRRLLMLALAGVAGALYIRDLGLSASTGAVAAAALASVSAAEPLQEVSAPAPFYVDDVDVSVRISTCVS